MSTSLISLGLGFGGGKASTSSGRIDSGLATPSISVVQLGADGATISTTGVSGATSYTYERDTSSSFSSPTTVSSGTLDLSVNDSGLSQGTLYYYRIIATDGVDTSTSATASLLILAVFTTSTLTDGGNLASNDNPFTFTVQPSTNISAGGTLTIAGLTGSGTADNASLTVGGAGATIFGSSADWTQSTGTLVLTVAGGQTLSTGSDTVVTFTLTNSSSSSGVTTSATLSASGFVSATMTGDYLEAFANRYNIPDSTDQQTEATILALSPTNPSGEVTVKFGSDTYDLYVWDGSIWYIYNNDYTP
jgi:LysM repeat protein